ncbi:hypothetical protein Tco_0848979 [Tanacetum coccineum]
MLVLSIKPNTNASVIQQTKTHPSVEQQELDAHHGGGCEGDGGGEVVMVTGGAEMMASLRGGVGDGGYGGIDGGDEGGSVMECGGGVMG